MPGELCQHCSGNAGLSMHTIYKAATAHTLWPDKYNSWHLRALQSLFLHERRLPGLQSGAQPSSCPGSTGRAG